MINEKLEWSVVCSALVTGARFEESGMEGKRSVLALILPDNRRIELRLTQEDFRYLLRKMKESNHHREEFTQADGEELHRWIKKKYIKVRVQKYIGTKRLTVEFVNILTGCWCNKCGRSRVVQN
jgi:hypothetical protein